MGTLEVWVLAVCLHPLGFWGILQQLPVWIDPAKAFTPLTLLLTSSHVPLSGCMDANR